MAHVKTPTVFTYEPDSEKTLDENLIEIMKHVKTVVQDAGEIPFKFTLEVDSPAMDAGEVADLVQQAQLDAAEMEEREINPPIEAVGVDSTDGKMVYKSKN